MFGVSSDANFNGCEENLDYVIFMNYRNGGDTGEYLDGDYSDKKMDYYIQALKNGTNPREPGSNNYLTGGNRFPKKDPQSSLINCWSFSDSHCEYVEKYDNEYAGTAYYYVKYDIKQGQGGKISKTCT